MWVSQSAEKNRDRWKPRRPPAPSSDSLRRERLYPSCLRSACTSRSADWGRVFSLDEGASVSQSPADARDCIYSGRSAKVVLKVTTKALSHACDDHIKENSNEKGNINTMPPPAAIYWRFSCVSISKHIHTACFTLVMNSEWHVYLLKW